MVRMVPGSIEVGRRRLNFTVSDNAGPSDGVWAVNIHGFMGGSGTYGRESAILADRLGWRVVNPSLPGFGGSTPLGWRDLSVANLAREVGRVLDHLGAGPAVLLGHSMGGAVAVRYAHDRPDATLGLVYRAGIATPAWKQRRAPLPAVVGPRTPTITPVVDFAASALVDLPDLFVGRVPSTVRAVLPDVGHNLRSVTTTLPVARLLFSMDLQREVAELRRRNLPILAEWGCFDRLVGPATAAEFARIAGTTVQWVPGGHSWMVPRPQGQADVLHHLASGRRFLAGLEERSAALGASEVSSA